MTDEDLKLLRGLAEAATAGPWYTTRAVEPDGQFDGTSFVMADAGALSARLQVCDARNADAAFIAAAREAVPALVIEVERLKRAMSHHIGQVAKVVADITHADLLRERNEARQERDEARAELAKPINYLNEKSKCPACGKMTRITTAGCDHCNLEDK